MPHRDHPFLRYLLRRPVGTFDAEAVRRHTRSDVLLFVMGAILFILLWSTNFHFWFGHERAVALLNAHGLIVQGTIHEVPARPTRARRGWTTTNLTVQYRIGTGPVYHRLYPISINAYGLLAQYNLLQQGRLVSIQYLPTQPLVSRLVIYTSTQEVIPIVATTLAPPFLAALFCITILFTLIATNAVLQVRDNDYQETASMQRRNQALRWRRSLVICLFIISACTIVSMWPLSDAAFVQQCWPQTPDDEWSTC